MCNHGFQCGKLLTTSQKNNDNSTLYNQKTQAYRLYMMQTTSTNNAQLYQICKNLDRNKMLFYRLRMNIFNAQSS